MTFAVPSTLPSTFKIFKGCNMQIREECAPTMKRDLGLKYTYYIHSRSSLTCISRILRIFNLTLKPTNLIFMNILIWICQYANLFLVNVIISSLQISKSKKNSITCTKHSPYTMRIYTLDVHCQLLGTYYLAYLLHTR